MGIADEIRRKLDEGLLPRSKPEKIFGGNGFGEPCTACGDPILPAQVLYEFDEPIFGTVRFHVGCLGLWEAELYHRGWWRPSESA